MKAQDLTRAWWIDEEDKILGGMYPASILSDLVDAYDVTAYLNLQEPDEANYAGVTFPDYLKRAARLANEAVESLRVPIPDMSIPLTDADVDAALDFLVRMKLAGRTTYAHCWGGHGRTGIIAACYLKCIKGYSADEAFERIAHARKHSPYLTTMPAPQTETQRMFVKLYEYRSGVQC